MDTPSNDCRVVYSTYPNIEEAEEVGRQIIQLGYVACVNIIPNSISIYEWEGKLERDNEVIMVLKTTLERAQTVVNMLVEKHSYDNPAVVILHVTGGSKQYLDWIVAQTSNSETST